MKKKKITQVFERAVLRVLEKYLNKFIQKFICYLNFIMPR